MVFGWGKKKKSQETEISIQQEREIKLSDVKSKINEIQSLREKTILAEAKAFRKKIVDKLDEVSKIIKELEKDSLKVEDIDKHLEILVVRGKKQVIDTIKRENAEKLPDLKSYDDVVSLATIVSKRLKRFGDALGRQSRVIHIFAHKYAAKLKGNLAILNSDRSELQTLIDNYSKLTTSASEINEQIAKYTESKKRLQTNQTKINDAEDSIKEYEKNIAETNKSISDFKSGQKYLNYLETQKKLDSLSSEKNQIKSKIDTQFTKISRPLSRYEYGSSLEKPQKMLMETLASNPFDVLTPANKDDIIKILSAVRKGIEGGSISVKDSEKSIGNIDETIEMLDEFIKEKSEFTNKKINLQKELDTFDIKELKQKEDFLAKTESEKSDAESKIQRVSKEVSDIQKSLPQILTDIEKRLRNISATKYSISE